MKNQLAIVCPTAHLESYVKSTFMKEPLITTALGTTLHTNNEESIRLLAETIEINNVDRVSFVADVNTMIIRKFLEGRSTGMLTVDRFYQYIYDQYEARILETDSSYKQRFTFVEYLVREQVKELYAAFDHLSSPMLNSLNLDAFIVDRTADIKWSVFESDFSIVK